MSVPLMLLGLMEREPGHGFDLERDYDSYFGQGSDVLLADHSLYRLEADLRWIAQAVSTLTGAEG
jgi:hypothetical protein